MEMVEFCDIPADCRLRVLGYLTPTDLYAHYAYCSRMCHDDSLDSDLPQTRWGEFHVGIDTRDSGHENEISMESILQRIAHPSFERAWRAPRSHMKIVGHEKNDMVVSADDLSFEEMQEMASGISFASVTSLDMSGDEDDEEVDSDHSQNRALPRCLPWLLSAILPGLCELDFSNLRGDHEGDYISELSLFNASNCPNIRKVTWTNRVGGCYFLRGKDMRSLNNLKELNFDNILCDWRFDKLFCTLISQFFDEASVIQRFFFFACNTSLERVSLRGGRYIPMGPKREEIIFPQWALMRFVRRTATLKWFRSDLTQENIELLQKERPDIHFCS